MGVQELITMKLPFAHLRNDVQVMRAITDYELPIFPKEDKDPLKTDLFVLCQACWSRQVVERPSVEKLRSRVKTMYPS